MPQERRKEHLPVPALALDDIRNGNRLQLARTITRLESSLPADIAWSDALLRLAMPYSGHALRIGITGIPGAGKSTFIGALGKHILQQGKKLAVLAIDPSSTRSKGSILADKTRMGALASHPDVFIRPSPAGQEHGGIAPKTRETVFLLEAAGFDIILVETIGVGQGEIAVDAITDIFLLLLIAGAGDSLQGIKRGIMEMADILCINKADGANIERAALARAEYARAIHLFPPSESGWTPTVEICSALTDAGIDTIWSRICDFETSVRGNGYFMKKRGNQMIAWFRDALQNEILYQIRGDKNWKQAVAAAEEAMLHNRISPPEAARNLLASLFPPLAD